jgi:tRNA threonylcarbamoyl adenosine modification protein (Sua5/YciO/YrdC/YwlC family)
VGDLNSEPDTGAVQLLARGRVDAGHPEWAAHWDFSWGDQEEEAGEGGDGGAAKAGEGAGAGAACGAALEHGWELASADELCTPFTNFVRGYVGCLDYVFYQPARMAVAHAVPLPSEAALRDDALPSARFPSDHLSLCVDLDFHPRGAPPPPAPPAFRYPARLSARRALPQPATPHLVYKAAAALRAGRFVAVPTDTLYGLAAAADAPAAVQAMVDCKQRAPSKAVAIAVADVADVARFGDAEGLPAGLLEALLPGPVTVILARRADAPLAPALAPRGTVGIRVPGADPNRLTRTPAFSFVRALARALGRPVALTSANLSNRWAPRPARPRPAPPRPPAPARCASRLPPPPSPLPPVLIGHVSSLLPY